ncbi:MAG: hypothetical protein H7245_15570 [Candidatus Saccharibacteria bacterium]|nr:hypothetical protein [Pseudorhodobacter sp.]
MISGFGAAGDDFSGDGGSDNLHGLGGDDLLYGGADADRVSGGLGDGTIIGGPGGGTLSGGLGADDFPCNPQEIGIDQITFYDADDRLLFVGIAPARVNAEQQGDDVKVAIGTGAQILVLGTVLDDLGRAFCLTKGGPKLIFSGRLAKNLLLAGFV